MAMPSPRRSLPLGVAILSVLIGLVGVVLLLAGILLVIASSYAYFHEVAFFGLGIIGGVLLLVFSLVFLVVAVGLWRLEMWALALAVIVMVILLIERLVAGPILSIGTLLLALILVYLIAVRRHFT